MTYWLRLYCQWAHRGMHLKPSIVGGLRCERCGAGFADKVDAGLMDEMSVQIPRPWPHVVEDGTFGVIEYKLLRRGKVEKVVRFQAGEPREIHVSDVPASGRVDVRLRVAKTRA